VKLLRTVELLHVDAETQEALVATGDDLAEAQLLLKRLSKSRGRQQAPTRSEARGLVELLGRVTAQKQRHRIVRLLCKAPSLSWRRMWAVWEETAFDFPEVATELARRIARFTSNGKRRLHRLPPWLPKRPERLTAALEDPRDVCLRFVEKARTPIGELYATLGISLASTTGIEVVFHILSGASESWWSLAEPDEMRTWASGHALPFRAAVAERQLLSVGEGAAGPSDVQAGRESETLKRWILEELDDPTIRPANWDLVTEEAAQIFEWLLLRGELAKILREFRKHAEDERADFWQCYFDDVRDARLVHARESSVCMMVFKDVLVIEFGRTGNACYFYRAPRVPLRSLRIRDKPVVAEFKSPWLLELDSESLQFHFKRSHRGAWQFDFIHQLWMVFDVDSDDSRRKWKYRG